MRLPKIPQRARLLLALPLSLISIACQEHPAKIPPADKLVCDAEPGRPAGQGPDGAVTDAEVAGYMGDLRSAGQSCRSDVDWLRDFFKE